MAQRTASGPDFFTQLGLSGLPAEERAKLLQKVELTAREQVISMILEALDDKDCRDLDQLIERGATESDILVFIRERIPDLEELVSARIERFKDDLISQVRSIRTDIQHMETAAPEVIPVDKKKARDELKMLEKESNRALVEGRFDQLRELHERILTLKSLIAQ